MSNFLERAKRRHSSGDVTGAAFMLADGLRRDHTNIDALEWFLHLYVRELTRAGAERELITVLQSQPNGGMLYAKVCARLEEAGDSTRLEALRREASRRGVPVDTGLPLGVAEAPPQEPEPVPERPPLRTPVPSMPHADESPPAENWDAFSSPLDGTGSRQAVQVPEQPGPVRSGAAPSPEPDETVDLDIPSLTADGRDRSRYVLAAIAAAVLLAIAAAFLLIPGRPEGGGAALEPATGSGATP